MVSTRCAPSALEVQPQHVALRLDLEQSRAVPHLRLRDLLEPSQVVGPHEARDSIQRIERFRSVHGFEPRAKAQRDVTLLGAGHGLRRAQLVHARDRPPNASLAGLGLVDHVDTADTFAAQAVGDGNAALPAADDHDVVVDARTRANPVGRVAACPAQNSARLRFELLACASAFSRSNRLAARYLCERGRRAQGANGQRRCTVEEAAPVDTGWCFMLSRSGRCTIGPRFLVRRTCRRSSRNRWSSTHTTE